MGLAVWLWTGSAIADDAVALEWSVPAASTCPDASYALAELERYVGPARVGRQPVLATVRVQDVGGGEWQLLLVTDQAGVRGQRELRDVSCRALVDAAMVILAWMVDPDKMAESAAGPKPEPALAPAGVPSPIEPAAVKPRPAQLRGFLGLEAGADAGTLPSLALDVGVRAGVSLHPVRWAAYAAYYPDSRKELGGELSARFRLWSIGAQTCLHPAWTTHDSVAFGACAGVELDLLRGETFGVSSPGHGSKAWLAGVLELSARFRLSTRFELVARAAGVLPSTRENFAVHGLGVVHQPSAGALRLGLGVESFL